MLDYLLSQHFSCKEMIITSHRTINNVPPPEVIDRLRVLCQDFLEPIRLEFGPLYITSGYRCAELNRAIGGATDSAHLYGCAADFVPFVPHSLQAIITWIVNTDLQYDQVIIEHSSTSDWVHIGMLRPEHEAKPRRQALRFNNGVYTPWP